VRIERCPDADIGRRRVSGEEMNQPKRKEQER
jgi:hypothetical protein